jgi:hypothetical protein
MFSSSGSGLIIVVTTSGICSCSCTGSFIRTRESSRVHLSFNFFRASSCFGVTSFESSSLIFRKNFWATAATEVN